MNNAGQVTVGEVVEFEVGEPVRVCSIEDKWTDQEDPHPYLLQTYGKSLVFHCEYVSDFADPVQTLAVRREKSPISGDRVVR